MSKPIKIRMGGYGPPTTGFSKSLKFIGDRLEKQFGNDVAIEYVFNIMDHGHKAEDILTLVENGEITLGYQSSSYLTDRVPELGFVDLPFLFSSNAQARGAKAMRMDLTEAIAMIKAGTLDAQENPLANTVTYGVHKFHRFHTLSYHFYISRPIFLHRASFEAWPEKIQRAMQTAVTEAVAYQRKLALEENQSSRKAIEAEGCEINELTSKEHDAFVAAVQPLLADARKTYGETMFRMVPKA